MLAAAIALLPLAFAGCSSGPPPLEIVPTEAPTEPKPAPRFLLELRVSGAVEVPLPPNDSSQRIESLFWVVPQGDYELVESEGRRLLKTSADASLELKVRFALPERDLPAVPGSLAPRLKRSPDPPGLEPDPDPDLRSVTVLDWSGAHPRLLGASEARIGEEWWHYVPEEGRLRPRGLVLSFGDASLRGLETATYKVQRLDAQSPGPVQAHDERSSEPPTPRGS